MITRREWLTGIGGVLMMGGITSGSRASVIKKTSYKGWDDCTLLTNNVIELIFVPQIGRIMRYGYVGGVNMLWENEALAGKTTDLKAVNADWQNYGGDKLWPAPQAVWGWPPDPVMDSGVHTVKTLAGDRIQTLGQKSPKHNLRFRRDIIINGKETSVTFLNSVFNTGDKEMEWSVWEVTQVASPDAIIMPLHKGGKFPAGYYTFKDADPVEGKLKIVSNEVRLERDAKRSSKIGGDSPLGWIASEKSGVRFEVSHRYDPKATYPDDGCHLEIYTNPDPLAYIEMELLSPIVKLAPGERCNHVTRWKLSKIGRSDSGQAMHSEYEARHGGTPPAEKCVPLNKGKKRFMKKQKRLKIRMVGGIALGLGIFAIGTVQGQEAPPDQVVLTVNGESVMMSEYFDRLQRMRATDFIVSTNPFTVRTENSGVMMMNSLIMERLTFQWAVKTNQMPKEEEITADFERLKQQPNITQALQSGQLTEKLIRYDLRLQKARYNIATTGMSADAKEIETWYKAHLASFSTPGKWGFSAIMTSSAANVSKIQSAFKAGKSFEELAKQYSEETRTKANGGDLGVIAANEPRIPEAVRNAAKTLKLNEPSAPIKTELALTAGKPAQTVWWFVRVKSREPGTTRPFGEVKDFVERQAVLDKAGGLQTAEKKITEFRKTAAIKIMLPLYKMLENAGS